MLAPQRRGRPYPVAIRTAGDAARGKRHANVAMAQRKHAPQRPSMGQFNEKPLQSRVALPDSKQVGLLLDMELWRGVLGAKLPIGRRCDTDRKGQQDCSANWGFAHAGDHGVGRHQAKWDRGNIYNRAYKAQKQRQTHQIKPKQDVAVG